MPAKRKPKLDLTMTPEMEAYADEVKSQLDKLKNEKIQTKVERMKQKGKVELDLSDKRLNELPEELEMPDCEAMDISRNNLTALPASVFDKWLLLQKLDISRNQFEELPDSIEQLANLEELHMQSNRLETLPGTLGSLRLLKYFDFSRNSTRRFPDEIAACHMLRVLKCSHNEIQVLPEAEWCLLERIDAFSNLISKFPGSVGSWLGCKSINLSCNAIDEVPAAISELKHLEELYLTDNMLKTLPVEFGQLTSLQKLSLGKNALKNERDGVEVLMLLTEMTELRELYIHKNYFTSLPAEFANLTNMVKFSAANNKLVRLPPRLAVWEQLEELYLSHNDLKSLPKTFGAFRKLREFQVASNPNLDTLPKGMAENRTLQQVDLRDCSSEMTLDKQFGALPHCRWQGVKMGKDKKKKKKK